MNKQDCLKVMTHNFTGSLDKGYDNKNPRLKQTLEIRTKSNGDLKPE